MYIINYKLFIIYLIFIIISKFLLYYNKNLDYFLSNNIKL
jgi:hypothetical protein